MEGNLAYLVPERITIALIFVYTGICNRKLGLESPYITKETKKTFLGGFSRDYLLLGGWVRKIFFVGLEVEVRGQGWWCLVHH